MLSAKTTCIWVFGLCLGVCLKILGCLCGLSTINACVYDLDEGVVLVFEWVLFWCFGV
jgi:hypothetical protein